MNTITNTTANKRAPRRAKVQSTRKLGHLWRVGYGFIPGEVALGYGTTRTEARAQAKERFDAESFFSPDV
jgi:hypothetical protein